MTLLDEVVARLGALPEKQRAILADEALAATRDLKWVPNPGPQTEAYFCQADELLFGGEAGPGKGLALDTPIPTPTGWITMGSVAVGDVLFDMDGKPCRVIGVSPINVHRPCFRIRFSDETEIVADDVHRWLTTTDGGGEIRNTAEIAATLLSKGHRTKIGRRYIVAVDPVASVPTKCMAVDSPTRTYLVSHAFVPTHNTDLLLGCAFTAHQRSLIMRRQYTDMGALIERALQINGSRDGFNGAAPPRLRTSDERLIEFGAAAKLGDETHWQGQPHDLLGFDEVVQFLQAQVRFLMGWVRSTDPSQKCRVIMASNPPVTADGQWIIPMFRPWLDITHPKPAKHGELRWFVVDPDGEDMEVEGPAPHQFPGTTRSQKPVSRTFIPGTLADNPYLIRTDYAKRLDALPEPLRSAFRDGNFMAAREDAANQAIPTAWVQAAQQRWTPQPPRDVPMCAIGVDMSGGGRDPMILAARHDAWFAPMIEVRGSDIPSDRSGKYCAGVIVAHRRDRAPIVLDMGGGFGSAVYEHLKENEIEVIAYKGAEGSVQRTADRQLPFFNRRSEAIWRFREALDPDQPGGSPAALPNDPALLADLTAPTFEVGSRGIKVESKEDVVKRLGRSTDRGDAVVMSWAGGMRNLVAGQFVHHRHGKPEVITKRTMRRRR